MGGGEHAHGGDFRAKVWSMSGGPYCRPKHWKRNTAFAMFGVFLICIPIAMKSAELEAKHRKSLLNVGGPDRLSRVQMAETVADIRGYNLSLIKSVSASSVDHGVVSPADISMDISKLVQTPGISPISFGNGVRLTLEL
ncbi:uncharacterized protein LOC112181020 isoform X2 [Rosa chinensis]|uniref:uncharacterized protein LOC112181020 isoform X2 n=1 Tax=Rosa chinensis TaxID=74649 RepID=UPI001AD8EF92|nr:uncharacterized protein LOC112181020 isoform X2 [Rosa chinensis]